MQAINQKTSPLWGAIIGALVSPVLIALFFVGERFANLPFLPLNFFDWIARALPGELITFGIDTMVELIIAVGAGDNLDDAAKLAERVMGVGLFWTLGVVTAAVFFLILNQIDWDEVSYTPGAIYGLAFGIPLMALAIPISITSPAPLWLKVVWSGLLFLGYGVAIGWAYNMMSFGDTTVKANTGEVSTNTIDRREFIVKVGGASATLTVVGAGLGGLLGNTSSSTTVADAPETDISADSDSATESVADVPNTDSGLMPAPGTRPEITPVRDHYRIDILSSGLPSIPDDYTLPITGLVANEVAWSLEEIMDMPSQSEILTMSCISNRIAGSLISTVKWTGVSFQEILDRVEPTEEAMALKIIGYDNFDEYLELDMIRNDDRIMLAYHFDDAPLPLRNGFPLRIHIPNRYGMKQPKWIRSIEFVDAWEPGYWVRRSWSEQAIVNAVSVIDTVATDDIFEDENGIMRVPMGGMAWAGDRPIVSVQVSIDGGEWQNCELRESLSERAWTIWRYDWAFEEGDHTVEVRAFEAAPEGQSDPLLQPTETRGVRPDGATGIHAESFSLASVEGDTEASIDS
ncbi:MAG: molybdopterin-dependent oxidoreductase [Chloroflexota bacterium]